MENILLRQATAKDLTEILEIINYNILHTTAVYDYEPKTVKDIEVWLLEKQQTGFPVYIAESNNHIAGYASYGTFKQKDGYRFTVEHSVYVAQNFTGKGIGKKLLVKLIEHAKTKRIHCMIGLIDVDNSASINFHKKHGFTEAGTIKQAGYKFNRWLDVQIMQLLL